MDLLLAYLSTCITQIQTSQDRGEDLSRKSLMDAIVVSYSPYNCALLWGEGGGGTENMAFKHTQPALVDAMLFF